MAKPEAGDQTTYGDADATVTEFNEDEGTVSLWVDDMDCGFSVTIDYIPCDWFTHLNRY